MVERPASAGRGEVVPVGDHPGDGRRGSARGAADGGGGVEAAAVDPALAGSRVADGSPTGVVTVPPRPGRVDVARLPQGSSGGPLSAAGEYWLWHSFRGLFRSGLAGEEDAAAEQVGLARPYICRLSILMRLTWPSTAPELQGRLSPLVTASWSARSPVTKERSPGSPVARATVIHGSRSLRPRRSFMMAAKARTPAVTAASCGDAARIASRLARSASSRRSGCGHDPCGHGADFRRCRGRGGDGRVSAETREVAADLPTAARIAAVADLLP